MAGKLFKLYCVGGAACISLVAGLACLNNPKRSDLIENQKSTVVIPEFTILGSAKFMKTEEIYKAARVQTSSFIPDEARQSFPIPIIRTNEVKFVFLFCPSFNSPAGSQIYPPNYLVRFDAMTGKMEEKKAVMSADFSMSHSDNKPLGNFVLPPGITVQEYLDKRRRLFELYDTLIPEFSKGQPKSSLDTKRQVVEFMNLFSMLKEPPLTDYYLAVGKDFFDWIKRSASQ